MNFLSTLLSPIALGALEVTLIIVAVIILGVIAASFRLVTQTKKVIVERLGGYYTTWGVGIHFLVPILDRQVKTVSLKEQVKDFEPQPVITRDNVTMQIDTVVFFAITDPKAYTYGTENPMMAIENISATKINELSTFVFKLWKRDRLPEEDEAVSLRKVITLYYKSIEKDHSFPQFYEFIDNNKEDIMKVLDLNQKFFDIEDFLHITSEFIGRGIYSFLFEAKTDDSYKIEGKKFIIFELDEIKDNQVLLTIMLHMISEAVQKVVWKDRSTKGVIFFDEFAKMLKFPSVLSSAEYFYQAARKQEAAIGIVLQSPSQLPKNDASNAMIDNTQVMYIMQNEKGYKEIIERLSLKEHDENQLGSIKYNFTGKIKYSEFLLKIGSESNIMRLELARKVLLAFQTEGKEYTEVMELYKETGDMESAI
ncbi:MAG: hypothetical protein CVV62_00875, partial [Tenericutes bacterium HGW-Tenericutes-7]